MDYRQQLIDFIECANSVNDSRDFVEEIRIEGDLIESDAWIGEETCGFQIVPREELKEDPVCISPYDDDLVDYCMYKTVSLDTRESYLALCKEIMRKKFWLVLACEEEHSYRLSIEDYIKQFAKRLKKEWECFSGVSLENLPIRVTSDDAGDKDGAWNGTTRGTYTNYNGFITVNHVFQDLEKANKETARHETIHFMLAKADLPYGDADPLFWVFATIYDANPYETMNEHDQGVFDSLMNEYKQPGGKEKLDGYCVEIITERKKNLALIKNKLVEMGLLPNENTA